MGLQAALESLDVELLGKIPSQTSDEDKRSLLALHLACRRRLDSFRWLEIGSYLGGSLQALIRDPACVSIESIDSRPEQLPDERIASLEYPDNSTQRMIQLLGDLPEANVEKLRTHEADTAQLDPEAIERPDICFIDGEHTDDACARDAEFCRRVVRDRGVIAFHDVGIVYRAVAAFVEALRGAGMQYHLAYLPEVVFVVELGRAEVTSDPAIVGRQLDAGEGLLSILCTNDRYRAVLKGRRARMLRRLGLLRIDDPTLTFTPSGEHHRG